MWGRLIVFLALPIPGPLSVSLFSRVSFQPRSQVLFPGWERTREAGREPWERGWVVLCSSVYGYSTINE